MPSSVDDLLAHRLDLVVAGALSMRFVAMNCGEIQRVRIASSTFG